MAPKTLDQVTDPNLTAQLRIASDQLKVLENQIRLGNVDLRVLTDFREALNHVRHTSWAVQKWCEEEKRDGGDPFSVMSMVAAERVRITTQLIKELLIDFESNDMELDTPGLHDLHKSVAALFDRLKMVVKSQPPK